MYYPNQSFSIKQHKLKLMKKLFILSFVAIMATVAIGCKGKAKTETKTEEPKKEEKPSTAKLMEGDWNLISIAGKEMPKDKSVTYNFKSDGTGTIVAGKKTTQMKWEVKQKDGKEFLSTKTEKDEEFEIKSIDAKKVVIVDKSGDIEMQKK